MVSIVRTLSGSSSRGSIRSTISSANPAASSKKRRAVRFGPIQNQEVEQIPEDCRVDVFYSQLELQQVRKQEVADIRKAIKVVGSKDIEGPTLTWRGIEDFQHGTNKLAKARYHTTEVLNEWQRQVRGGYTDHYALRTVSKHLSKEDRLAAVKFGELDAQAAGHCATKKSAVVERRPSSAVKKTIATSLTWLKRQTTPTSISPRALTNQAA